MLVHCRSSEGTLVSVVAKRWRRLRYHTSTAVAALVRLVCVLFLSLTSVDAATVDGLQIHSTVTGNGATTVFLVHGYTCDETSWAEQVQVLARQYRVVTLDLPGHGKSDRPRVEQFSMGLFARAIEAVRLDVKADRIVLVGHSMGTPVILKYAALVFVDGLMPAAPAAGARAGGSPASPVSGVDAPQSAGARMGGPNGRQNREAMVRRFFVPTTTPVVQQKVLDMMLGAPEATAVGAMNASSDPAARTTDVPDVPMNGIYADPNAIASRDAVLRNFPKAAYSQVPGTGHFLMLEKPIEFNALLLNFLATIR
jgi:pimeloyl-ACP methyl ester carboxylesterase